MELQLKVCSARNLPSEKTTYPYVYVQNQGVSEKTPSRKYNSGQSIVYWNHTFKKFYVNPGDVIRMEIRSKDWTSFLGTGETFIGIAEVPLPKDINVFDDLWLPILNSETHEQLNAQIHVVAQLEHAPRAPITNSPSDKSNNNNVANSSKQSRPWGALSKKMVRQTSKEFDGKAAAATINELIYSLEKVKLIIHPPNTIPQDGSQRLTQKESGQDRLKQLRIAKTDLENIQDQLKSQDTLPPEWQAKLVDLAESYSNDLTMLLSAYAWNDVNRRSETPKPPAVTAAPALPPRPSPGRSAKHLVKSQSQNVSSVSKFVNYPQSKQYSIDNLDLFDMMMDNGYCVNLVSDLDGEAPKIQSGDGVSLDYIGYIWDSVNCAAVAFNSTTDSGLLRFNVDEADIPRGLSKALIGLTLNTCAQCIVTPAFGYGDKGNELVPPETHLLYEFKIVEHVVNTTAHPPPSHEIENVEESTSTVRYLSGGKYAARENRLSLALAAGVTPPVTEQKTPLVPTQPTQARVSPPTPRCNTPDIPVQYHNPMPPPPAVPPVHSASVSSIDAAAAMSMSVTEWLTRFGLAQYSQHFIDMGVESVEDLELVVTEDLEKMGMRVIQIRKFAASMKKTGLNTSVQC